MVNQFNLIFFLWTPVVYFWSQWDLSESFATVAEGISSSNWCNVLMCYFVLFLLPCLESMRLIIELCLNVMYPCVMFCYSYIFTGEIAMFGVNETYHRALPQCYVPMCYVLLFLYFHRGNCHVWSQWDLS